VKENVVDSNAFILQQVFEKIKALESLGFDVNNHLDNDNLPTIAYDKFKEELITLKSLILSLESLKQQNLNSIIYIDKVSPKILDKDFNPDNKEYIEFYKTKLFYLSKSDNELNNEQIIEELTNLGLLTLDCQINEQISLPELAKDEPKRKAIARLINYDSNKINDLKIKNDFCSLQLSFNSIVDGVVSSHTQEIKNTYTFKDIVETGYSLNILMDKQNGIERYQAECDAVEEFEKNNQGTFLDGYVISVTYLRSKLVQLNTLIIMLEDDKYLGKFFKNNHGNTENINNEKKTENIYNKSEQTSFFGYFRKFFKNNEKKTENIYSEHERIAFSGCFGTTLCALKELPVAIHNEQKACDDFYKSESFKQVDNDTSSGLSATQSASGDDQPGITIVSKQSVPEVAGQIILGSSTTTVMESDVQSTGPIREPEDDTDTLPEDLSKWVILNTDKSLTISSSPIREEKPVADQVASTSPESSSDSTAIKTLRAKINDIEKKLNEIPNTYGKYNTTKETLNCSELLSTYNIDIVSQMLNGVEKEVDAELEKVKERPNEVSGTENLQGESETPLEPVSLQPMSSSPQSGSETSLATSTAEPASLFVQANLGNADMTQPNTIEIMEDANRGDASGLLNEQNTHTQKSAESPPAQPQSARTGIALKKSSGFEKVVNFFKNAGDFIKQHKALVIGGLILPSIAAIIFAPYLIPVLAPVLAPVISALGVGGAIAAAASFVGSLGVAGWVLLSGVCVGVGAALGKGIGWVKDKINASKENARLENENENKHAGEILNIINGQVPGLSQGRHQEPKKILKDALKSIKQRYKGGEIVKRDHEGLQEQLRDFYQAIQGKDTKSTFIKVAKEVFGNGIRDILAATGSEDRTVDSSNSSGRTVADIITSLQGASAISKAQEPETQVLRNSKKYVNPGPTPKLLDLPQGGFSPPHHQVEKPTNSEVPTPS
jgi:hypothetical protein